MAQSNPRPEGLNIFLSDELIEKFKQGKTVTKYELTIKDGQYVLLTTIEQRVTIPENNQDTQSSYQLNGPTQRSLSEEQKSVGKNTPKKKAKKNKNAIVNNENNKDNNLNTSKKTKNNNTVKKNKNNNDKSTSVKMNDANVNNWINDDYVNGSSKFNASKSKVNNNSIKNNNDYPYSLISNTQPDILNYFTDDSKNDNLIQSKNNKMKSSSESLIDLLKNEDDIDLIRITRRLSENEIETKKKKTSNTHIIPTKEAALQNQIDSLQKLYSDEKSIKYEDSEFLAKVTNDFLKKDQQEYIARLNTLYNQHNKISKAYDVNFLEILRKDYGYLWFSSAGTSHILFGRLDRPFINAWNVYLLFNCDLGILMKGENIFYGYFRFKNYPFE